MKRVIITVFICWTLLPSFLQAQDSLLVKYELRGGLEQQGSKYFGDEGQVDMFLASLLEELWGQGYLMAGFAQDERIGLLRKVLIETGQQFEWLRLSEGNVPTRVLEKAGFDSKKFSKQHVSFKDVQKVLEDILVDRENSGYPFAKLKLDSIVQSDYRIAASLNLENGPLITFDSLQVLGNSKIDPVYLSRYLTIIPGEVYSQEKVGEVKDRISRINGVNIIADPRVSFQNSEATVYLALEDRKVNTIDGIIGFLPNEVEENKVLVTGQFDLSLFNIGGRGRDYALHWQRLSQYTQNLNLSADEPMIFRTGVDVNASFSLLKEDTAFINREFRLGFFHPLSPDFDIGFFSSWRSGDLLSVPLGADESLPDVLDFRYNNYGGKISMIDLDDVYFPKRGWRAEVEFGVGNKRILRNTGIPEEMYEGLDMEALQYHMMFEVENYWRWTQKALAFVKVQAGQVEGANLLKNDMYRLGGLKSIRGFNENFFFANRYVYANFEPRFYFEEYSYFMGFVDWGWIEQKSQGISPLEEHPVAFGGGMSFSTKNGAFQFVLGLGKSNEQPLGVNYAKVHFGYTGRF